MTLPITVGAIHDRCGQDIANLLGSLALGGTEQRVYVQLMPDGAVMQFPCWTVTWELDTEEEDESDFEGDHVTYPIRVFLHDSSPTNLQEMRPNYLAWRRTAMRAMRALYSHAANTMDALPSVPECYDVRLRPQPVFDPRAQAYQYVVSGFEVLCKTAESRDN